MATIYDIASALGVSPSTVSRALRDGGGLNPETTAAIRSEARRQGYRPGKRALRHGSAVAILCPEVKSGFYARIVTTLSSQLSEGGYRASIFLTDFRREREEELLRTLPEQGYSGILCLTESRELGPALEEGIRTREIPVVQIGMSAPPGSYDNVRVDEQAGIHAALSHLMELGHRRIAFLGGKYSDTRRDCFCAEAEALGIGGDVLVRTASTVNMECGYELADGLVREDELPTAVLAEYDGVALGAIRRFGEAGISVPGDISVVGFDDADWCSFLTPSLTTVYSHSDPMCEIASSMLLKKLMDPTFRTVQNIQIIPDLIIRDSTAAPRRE